MGYVHNPAAGFAAQHVTVTDVPCVTPLDPTVTWPSLLVYIVP